MAPTLALRAIAASSLLSSPCSGVLVDVAPARQSQGVSTETSSEATAEEGWWSFRRNAAANGWHDSGMQETSSVNFHGLLLQSDEAKTKISEFFETSEWKWARENSGHLYSDSPKSDMVFLYMLLSKPIPLTTQLERKEVVQLREAVNKFKQKLYQVSAHKLTNSLGKELASSRLGESRLGYGSGNLFPLLTCLASTPTHRLGAVLGHVLTANPLLDADAANVARALFMGGGSTASIRAMSMIDLKDANVVDVGYITPASEFVNKSSFTGNADMHVSWMPALSVGAFSCVQKGQEWHQSRQQWNSTSGTAALHASHELCSTTAFPHAVQELKAAVETHANVKGVKVVGPEIYVLNTQDGSQGGRSRFTWLARNLIEAAETRKRPVVLNIDVGSGVPLFEKTKMFDDFVHIDKEGDEDVQFESLLRTGFGMKSNILNEVCQEAQKDSLMSSKAFPAYKNRVDPASCKERYASAGDANFQKAVGVSMAALGASRCAPQEPAHYEVARANLDAMIENVLAARKTLGGDRLDKNLKIRFVGATHATAAHAAAMRALNIGAEVHLTSDLVTGAMNWDSRYGSQSLFAGNGLNFRRSHSDRASILKDAQIPWAFAQHSVLKLMLAGVDVTMSSNGLGVTHSDLESDYNVLEALWKAYEQDGKDAYQKMISPYAKATSHMSQMDEELGQLYAFFKSRGNPYSSAARVLQDQQAYM